jgi:hypothetical protein
LCRFHLGCLAPHAQFDLVKRVRKGPKPTKKDWTLVFKPVDYEFTRSWHYRVNQMLVFSLGIVSILLALTLRNRPLEILATWLHARPLPPSAWIWLLASCAGTTLLGWSILLIQRHDMDTVCGVHACAVIVPIIGLWLLPLAWSYVAFGVVLIIVSFCFAVARLVGRERSIGDAILLFVLGPVMIALPVAMSAIFAAPVLTLAIYVSAWASAWLSWIRIAAGWAALVLVFTFLWARGLRLDRAAKNPLRSILEWETPAASQSRKRSLLMHLMHLVTVCFAVHRN